ncbi:MAG: glycoside hydrolase family 5 protein [Oscillospiraceae bacterium]|jgi:hypothetical protein|nr:glycoside hydrolase family 5 protein [Oscillospiraceae bacterium]
MDMFSFLKKYPRLLRAARGIESAACALSAAAHSDSPHRPRGPLTQADFLRTRGKDVVNRSGQQVFLRGVNAGGWLVYEEWMCPATSPDYRSMCGMLEERFGAETRDELLNVYLDHYWKEEDFDRCAALGVTALRLPFLYTHLADDAGKLRPDAFARLDWFVGHCQKRGIYVILDLHGAFGSQNGEQHSGQINDGRQLFYHPGNRAKTLRLWQAIARHYKGNPAVAGYDLLNEPMGPGKEAARTGKVHWDYFNELYRAIRAVDPDHIIIMEACWVAIHLPHPLRYGWKNVVYQYHYYPWGLGDSPGAIIAFNGGALLFPKLIPRGVPVLMGEFCCFGSDEAWRQTLQFSNQLRYHWTTWTYKVLGSAKNRDPYWGIYEHDTPKADIQNDSAETIRAIWSQLGTENCVPTRLGGILKAYLSPNRNRP